MSDMPERFVYVGFQLDTNRINSKQLLANVNRLERWAEDEVIELMLSEIASEEARGGNDHRRSRKALGYIYSMTAITTEHERWTLQQIEQILFPSGALDQNQRNDTEIVFNAGKYHRILVTNDGASRTQPGGILGNKARLAQLGIRVMTDAEAVAHVEDAIRNRDTMAKLVSQTTGEPIPSWVGRD